MYLERQAARDERRRKSGEAQREEEEERREAVILGSLMANGGAATVDDEDPPSLQREGMDPSVEDAEEQRRQRQPNAILFDQPTSQLLDVDDEDLLSYTDEGDWRCTRERGAADYQRTAVGSQEDGCRFIGRTVRAYHVFVSRGREFGLAPTRPLHVVR